MKNKLFFFFLLCGFLYAKDILVLHSYHKGYAWSDNISRGIEEYFKNTNINLITEYMDTKHNNSYQYKQEYLHFLQAKYERRKFDVIIASDNNALNFLEKNHDKIFQDTPIVFCGINNFSKTLFDKAHIKNRTTGVVESVDIKKNIDLILLLHPKLEKIVLINDRTTTGRAVGEQFEAIKELYKDKIILEYIDNLSLHDLKLKVSQLPKNSAILFMLLFEDKDGVQVSYKNGIEMIVKNTSSPVYGLWDFYFSHGLVGGYLTNGYSQGEYASKLAMRILEGEKPKDIDIVFQSPNHYQFDYHKLKFFHIDEKQLPNGSIVKNKPDNLFTQYRYELSLLLIVFIVCVIAIFILIIALLQKRKAKNELQIQLQFIQTLLDTVSIPIFYKNKKGVYIGANEAFYNFIGRSKYDILGKTMYDLFENQNEFLEEHHKMEEKLLHNEDVGLYTMEYHTPNGKIQTMLVNKSLYYDLDGDVKGVLTVLQDITKIKEIEDEKKQHESFLAQQSKLAEIGEMINAIAHQWNEPLVEMSAIVQDLELQYKTEGLSEKDIKVFVNDSMVQIQYMSKTLKDFRDFLKPSTQKSYFDIHDAFDEIFNIIERQIKYSYIDMEISYDEGNHVAYGYKNEFMQVLITIINNAKDAIAKEKMNNKNHKGKIDIEVTSKENCLVIHIIDNGCGIDDELKTKVFHPYFSTKKKGNGIGLYMSKVLIEDKMDGKIYFSENKQTELVIQLPKQKDSDAYIVA